MFKKTEYGKKLIRPIFCAIGILWACHANAWVGGRGDYYHGGYRTGGYYYNNGWAAHGVVIGVPEGAYYGYGCSIVQRCYENGCVNQRICE